MKGPATWKCHEKPVQRIKSRGRYLDSIGARGFGYQPLLSPSERVTSQVGPFCLPLFHSNQLEKRRTLIASLRFVRSMVHWPGSRARASRPPVGPLKYHVSQSRKKSWRIHIQIGTRKISSLSLELVARERLSSDRSLRARSSRA